MFKSGLYTVTIREADGEVSRATQYYFIQGQNEPDFMTNAEHSRCCDVEFTKCTEAEEDAYFEAMDNAR